MNKMKNPTIYNDVRFCLNYLEPYLYANPRKRRGAGPSGYIGGFTIDLYTKGSHTRERSVIVVNRGDKFNHKDMENLALYCVSLCLSIMISLF